MPGDPKVRAAAPGDAAALLPLVRALNREQGDPEDLITEAALAGLIAAAHVALAELDGAPIGYATGHATFETGHAEHGLYIGDLYVVPEQRRHGVGRALLAQLAATGKMRGARHLWLTAREDNTAAHAFYRRLGGKGERVLAFACVTEDFQTLAAEAAP
ncbi:GNAT family N-acetyltransferase [Roseomonas hellenica]|uniref:GNAT family N-acetyltransferase n=1 Tax=Plastoroseomonas hellenica TaxID=2687306 RepID=A0ABS5F1H8_9PROT|nr:GNAT family N-acetyltransferase [Plastoroseomonas hellenica]MBR0666404.1 GNAT family N-acetyltransferase [Plastoroseomonas hellenica]